ncbi:hypothetical protein LFYK43_04690 [Ligilactobacillus salitolerans]|uniref:Plasmid maintenance system killer protein n=1 Tax=Ligilactobacillus salitolerans TaxID=1808352 RepID=A0A401IR39_9LACO|nr:type II toxin-antitoxin system RelE/ParE family toxin [Ligilactobacillus salitolerans]GBG94010.1 hypothetical protein LFYK43_04690 [Ligilactobacillus salitolerans]
MENIKLEYKTKKIQNQCQDLKNARKKFGARIAEKLLALVNVLEAAENLQDINSLQVYHVHQLDGNRKNELALDIDGRKSQYRLIIRPLNQSDTAGDDVIRYYRGIEIISIEEVSKHYE